MPKASTRPRAATQPRPTTRPRPARPQPETAVTFSFEADRFGFRSRALRDDDAFARNLVDAVDGWAAAIETLFGDVETALRLAGEARILPMYPAWSTVRQFRDSINGQLKAQRGKKSIDASARFAVEELRLYLRDLSEWAGAFQIGVWAATIAGLGSAEADESARRLHGLRTLPAVYDIDKAASAEKVTERLREIRSVSGGLIPSALGKAALTHDRLTLPPRYFGEFVEAASEAEPSRIHDWLERLKTDAKSLADELSSIRSRSLPDIEKAYWRQWRWLSGTVTRDPDIPEVTLLDLVHAARHGNIPIVPTGGGRLSIGQWSRILHLALRPGGIVPDDIIDTALHTLRVPILTYSPTGEDRESDPIAVLRPRSAQSFAWSWAPQDGVRALALMPSDVAKADSADDEATGEADYRIEYELARVRSTDVLEFVELGGDMTLEAARNRAPLRTASERIFFGPVYYYGLYYYGPDYNIEAPEHARDLFDRTRKKYGHLFPVPARPERPFYMYVLMPWLPVWDVLRFASRWLRRRAQIAARLMRAGRTRFLPQIRARLFRIGS